MVNIEILHMVVTSVRGSTGNSSKKCSHHKLIVYHKYTTESDAFVQLLVNQQYKFSNITYYR